MFPPRHLQYSYRESTEGVCEFIGGEACDRRCRVAEDLAWAVNAPTDLPSRGATAFLHTLQLASEKAGHTHLPWEVLIMHTQRLLSSSGARRQLWPHDVVTIVHAFCACLPPGHCMLRTAPPFAPHYCDQT